MYAYSSPPMYSFGGSERGEELKTFTNFHTPGPGTYDEINPKTVKDGYPAWKMGNSKRPNLYGSSNKEVGPATYDPKKPDSKVVPKKGTLAKGKRGHSEFKGISTVGPDAYNPKGFGRVPPSFSFGYKTDGFGAFTKSDVPGPGTYEMQNTFDQPTESAQTTKTAFNRTAPHAQARPRDTKHGGSTEPGPGAHFNPKVDNYDFRYFTPTWSFGKSTRDDLYDETKNVPGPGKYNMSGTVNTKTGYTILGKNKSKGTSNDAPGPDAYHPDMNPLRKTAPAFRIGKAERKGLTTGDVNYPSPGAYDVKDRTFNQDDPFDQGFKIRARIGTSQRPGLYTHEARRNPGPGQYEVSGDIAKGVQHSMGVKFNVKKAAEVFPGPGEYEPFGTVYLDKNNGAIIGTSERPALYKKGVAPGPGQYDVRGNIGGGTKSKFGNGRRVPISKVNDEPGPGYYTLPSAIGNVPKYLLPNYAQEKRKAAGDKETSFRGIFG